MNAANVIQNILTNKNLFNANLKYCFIDGNKVPYKIDDSPARPNQVSDFVDVSDLVVGSLTNYAGVGVSIQASNICAVDIDDCFEVPFDVTSGDNRAKDIIDIFGKSAYVEFSFSGKGLRVLFKAKIINNYSDIYYIKNSNSSIEYYQPSNSFRYVTITGVVICDNPIKMISEEVLNYFLNKYMIRPKPIKKIEGTNVIKDEKSFEELWEVMKYHYLTNSQFQDVVFCVPQEEVSRRRFIDSLKQTSESDLDFYLLSYIYDNITQDKEKIKQLFENTYYFKHKDSKHIWKWEYNDNRYYNYVYSRLGGE